MGVYVRDFLVKAPFTGTNVADALQLFFKIILPKEVLRLFQALIVHDIALDDVFLNILFAQMRNMVAFLELTL